MKVVDRDMFVNMFDTEASPKEGAADLVFNLTAGGPPDKREFARVVTASKTAKIMAETKLQTDAVARAHGVPVTLLPCDWTSIVAEFKKKSAITLPTIDHQTNRFLRRADGTLKKEPLSHVVSLFEEEQQDSKKT